MFHNPMDPNNCFIDIQAGSGGTEAQDWAAMLLRMYLRYCERKGYQTEVLEESPGEVAGIKSASIKVDGDYAYGYLRTETGVHRLVRKSPFDSNARRHTSFASVFVYPEVDDSIEVEINPADLRIDTFRASGAGGQHINKTDSAVRITHLPTNIVVQCQNDRSQHRNRAEAMAMLKSKLYELELRKRQAEQQKLEDAKTDIGWGHQIRSYVLDQSRIKDLRTNVRSRQHAGGARRRSRRFHRGEPEAGSVTCPTNKSRRARPPLDENQIIAERRAQARCAARARTAPIPNDFRRDALAGGPARALRRADATRSSRRRRSTRRRRRPHDAEARDGQGELRDAAGHERAHPALRDADARRRRGARRVQALGPGRHRRRDGHAVQDASTGELSVKVTRSGCWRRRCGRCRRSSTA